MTVLKASLQTNSVLVDDNGLVAGDDDMLSLTWHLVLSRH